MAIIAGYLNDAHNAVTLRLAAVMGCETLGQNRHLYSEAARQRAVTALCEAVQHDGWHRVRFFAALALMAFGEKRAIPALERAISAELESRTRRGMRVAAHVLRIGGGADEQVQQLRKDLDQVREENRKLKERLGALETRIG